MKFSVNWLRDFVELPASLDQLAELLTMAGVEIEGIEKRGGDLNNVVIAQIREFTQHPNADRLSVCTVDDGSGAMRTVVCGAKNFKAGDKVPLALPGAHLPNGLTIKKSKLRGVESEGMLCSPIEIALGEDTSGLLVLSPDAPLGEPLAKLFPADTIFDVEITPNRPDLLSHYGLAREIAALTGKSAQLPPIGALPRESKNGVRISAPDECPFYSLRRIENVKVGRSPDWLRTRLEAAGVRSINNIVDISNFVMLELGQPTHAFDAAKISGGIDVRLARVEEKFLALDGRTYSLGECDLVIGDAERAAGIAGVMGGEESGVSDSTITVLLESAYFLPATVRRTARTLSLPSDASYRFERGVDTGMVLRASQRVTELIEQISGGKAADEMSIGGELPPLPRDVQLRPERAQRIIGMPIEPGRIDTILTSFGLTSKGNGAWKIPSYRRDLTREEDLIEEIVRGLGVANLPSTMRSRFTPRSTADRAFDDRRAISQRLVAAGFSEARTSVLLPRGSECAVELRNPLNEDNAALRPSLLGGLFDVLARNIRGGMRSIRLFEIGRVFSGGEAKEIERVAIVLHGENLEHASWRGNAARKLDIFDAKGAADLLGSFTLRRIELPAFALTAELLHGEEKTGVIGQLTSAHAAQLGASSAVVFAELNLEAALNARSPAKYREVDRFPAVNRDIAMIVPDRLPHEEILRVIRSTNESLLTDVRLFDIFAGQTLGSGKKSVAYSLTYRAKDRTLTSDEVTAVHTKIRDRLRNELGAELRE